MVTTGWDPWRELVTLRGAVHTLLGDGAIVPRAGNGLAQDLVPIDVLETADAFVVQLPLPGVEPSDVAITVLRDHLRISGELPADEPGEGRWLLRERRFGPFERSLTLPAPVSAERAVAEFNQGVLTIRLPKADEVRPKTIPVRTVAKG